MMHMNFRASLGNKVMQRTRDTVPGLKSLRDKFNSLHEITEFSEASSTRKSEKTVKSKAHLLKGPQ